MSQTIEHVRIGDLLLKAEIISSGYIQEALGNFEAQGLPLGKVLVVSGYLNDSQLRVALDLQFMVNDGLLGLDEAVSVLKACHQRNLSLDEGFEDTGIIQPEDKDTNKLGQLLLDSGVISPNILSECLEANQKTSLPLGHIVCHRGYVSQVLVARTLIIQQLVRRGQVIRDQGIKSLRFARDREKQLMQLEVNRGYRFMPLKNAPLLGDFLFEAKILPERQIRQCLVDSVVNACCLGEALIKSTSIGRQLVEKAVILQECLDNETLTVEEAFASLGEIKTRGISVVQAMAEVATYKSRENKARDLITLLAASGILEKSRVPESVQERLQVNYNQIAPVVKELLAQAVVKEEILYSALRAVDLVDRKVITQEKAIVSMDFSARSTSDIEHTLYMTGVTNRTRLRDRETGAE